VTETQTSRYRITKFGLHPDGHLHARIVIEGRPLYVDERYGSWQAPGKDVKGREVRKEVLSPYRDDLAARGRSFRKAKKQRDSEKRHLDALKSVKSALDLGYPSDQLIDALTDKGFTALEIKDLIAEAKGPR
jgi:hypothetical protein